MGSNFNKALDESDLPRTPPGRPVAVADGSNQAKEPLSDCVERRTLANLRRGMSRGKAVASAIKACEKSRPVRGKSVVHVDKAGATLGADSLHDHEEKVIAEEPIASVNKVGERQKGESVKDCVSRKIAILIREGKSQEQAAAVAFSLCEDR